MARGSMARNVLNKSYVSNESFTENGSGYDTVDMENTLQMNAALEDMDNQYADAQAIADEVDELDHNQTQYTNLANQIEEMGDNGGISVESAVILAFMCNKDGFDAPVTVSNEAFGGGRSVAQSRVAVESIRETVKGWWQKLKDWLKKLSTKLRKWWESNWAAAPRLAARAEALRKKAGDKSTTTKEKDLENDGLYKALGMKAGFGTLSQSLKGVTEMIDSAFGEVQTATIAHVESVSDFIGDLDFSEANATANIKAKLHPIAEKSPFKDLPNTLKMTAVNKDAGDRPDFVKNTDAAFSVYSSVELPGGKAFYAVLPTGVTNTTPFQGHADETVGKYLRYIADNFYRFEISCSDFSKKEIEGSGKKLPVAQRMEINAICDEVINIAKSVENYKKNFENQNSARNKLDKAGDRLTNSVSGSDDEVKDAGTAVSALNTIITTCNKMLSEPSTTFMRYIMKTANAAISYGESSLAKYENK